MAAERTCYVLSPTGCLHLVPGQAALWLADRPTEYILRLPILHTTHRPGGLASRCHPKRWVHTKIARGHRTRGLADNQGCLSRGKEAGETSFHRSYRITIPGYSQTIVVIPRPCPRPCLRITGSWPFKPSRKLLCPVLRKPLSTFVSS